MTGPTTRFGIARADQRCDVRAAGETAVFADLPDGEVYSFVTCAESWWQGERYGAEHDDRRRSSGPERVAPGRLDVRRR